MSKVFGWVSERLIWVACRRLHLDLEAEILGGLGADLLDRAQGTADVDYLYVLDVLRPYRREAGERPRADRGAGNRGRGFSNVLRDSEPFRHCAVDDDIIMRHPVSPIAAGEAASGII